MAYVSHLVSVITRATVGTHLPSAWAKALAKQIRALHHAKRDFDLETKKHFPCNFTKKHKAFPRPVPRAKQRRKPATQTSCLRAALLTTYKKFLCEPLAQRPKRTFKVAQATILRHLCGPLGVAVALAERFLGHRGRALSNAASIGFVCSHELPPACPSNVVTTRIKICISS